MSSYCLVVCDCMSKQAVMLMCVYDACSDGTQCVGFGRMRWTRLHLLHGSGQLDIRYSFYIICHHHLSPVAVNINYNYNSHNENNFERFEPNFKGIARQAYYTLK